MSQEAFFAVPNFNGGKWDVHVANLLPVTVNFEPCSVQAVDIWGSSRSRPKIVSKGSLLIFRTVKIAAIYNIFNRTKVNGNC